MCNVSCIENLAARKLKCPIRHDDLNDELYAYFLKKYSHYKSKEVFADSCLQAKKKICRNSNGSKE